MTWKNDSQNRGSFMNRTSSRLAAACAFAMVAFTAFAGDRPPVTHPRATSSDTAVEPAWAVGAFIARPALWDALIGHRALIWEDGI